LTGRSSTPETVVPNRDASGILDHPLSRVMTPSETCAPRLRGQGRGERHRPNLRRVPLTRCYVSGAWRPDSRPALHFFRFSFQTANPTVVARLDRAIQYSRDVRVHPRGLWNTGSPAFAGDDSERQTPNSSRHDCARALHRHCPSENGGRRECRVLTAPAASRAVEESTRVSHHR
jgi:hypothetical protein